MANINCDAASGRYRVKFRYGGTEYQRSIKTTDRKAAEAVKCRVEETLRLLALGRLSLPDGADVAGFVLSDGKHERRPVTRKALTLAGLFQVYRETLPPGAKEETTVQGEDRHIRHLKRLIGASRPAQTLSVADLQQYADRRSLESWRGRSIRPDTVRKEITTFRLIWNWAVERGLLAGRAPVKGVRLSKPDEKPPFMTWDEIEAAAARGGLDGADLDALWASLFLDAGQVAAFLDHVERSARFPFVYPLFAFAAHTGARRSEILRARVDDFDLDGRVVRIREKKKSRTKAVTYRHVDLTLRLTEAMRRWFAVHPGGSFALTQAGTAGTPISPSEAVHHFRHTVRASKWAKVRGFHVFRHSFASNAAAAGVDQRVIDEWMGHQTEEMRKRYRHLFPGQRQKAIQSIFGA